MIKLTVDNYFYWQAVTEDYLMCKDHAEHILNKNTPEGKHENEWKLLNCKVVAIVLKYIDGSSFEHVSNFDSAYRLFTKLESLIQKKTNYD